MRREDQFDFLAGERLEDCFGTVALLQQRFQGSSTGIVTIRECLLPGGHVQPPDAVVSLGGVGDREEEVKGPGDDEDFFVAELGAGLGELGKGIVGLVGLIGVPSGTGLSPLLGEPPEFLNLFEDVLPVVVLDDLSQKGSHGANVGTEGGVPVLVVDGVAVDAGGVLDLGHDFTVEKGSRLGKARHGTGQDVEVAEAFFQRRGSESGIGRRVRRGRQRRRQESTGRESSGRRGSGSQHGCGVFISSL
mmetsp:Transcript_64470/g.131141  ORF Transcript_64470/g.131141 Transcript_64470/m.131141 type:complete len:247 (-) Transcript_64470:84-824(-)